MWPCCVCHLSLLLELAAYVSAMPNGLWKPPSFLERTLFSSLLSPRSLSFLKTLFLQEWCPSSWIFCTTHSQLCYMTFLCAPITSQIYLIYSTIYLVFQLLVGPVHHSLLEGRHYALLILTHLVPTQCLAVY